MLCYICYLFSKLIWILLDYLFLFNSDLVIFCQVDFLENEASNEHML